MYANAISIYDFKCFKKAALELRCPGGGSGSIGALPNINLILGDNGGGKSSVLRAIAIAALAPALLESGFVAHRLVRRPGGKQSLLKLVCELEPTDKKSPGADLNKIELLARIDRRPSGSLDRLHLDKTPSSPMEMLIFDDHSPAFFVVGYGATRRTETGDVSEGSARRSRGLRYQRVAGLFEDHVALRPLQTWLPRIKEAARRKEAIAKLSAALPEPLSFAGELDEETGQYLFAFEGIPTPFTSLSDGYRAYISWVGDLIGHLCDVTPANTKIAAISGIVLVDEIDLHLHPSWQRTIVPTLAKHFPRLQFVLTSHSPLVASTVQRENIFVTATDDEGFPTIKQIEEKAFGRSSDQLLLSAYFGMDSLKPEALRAADRELFQRAGRGDAGAALSFLEQMAAPTSADHEISPTVRAILRETPLDATSAPRKRAKQAPTDKKAPSARRGAARKK